MILGRNAGLWAALVQAALNVGAAILVVVTNHDLTPAEVGLFAALNAFGLAVVGIIANESDPTSAATFAMTTRPPGTTIAGGRPTSTGSGIAGPSGGATPDPTTPDPNAADGQAQG